MDYQSFICYLDIVNVEDIEHLDVFTDKIGDCSVIINTKKGFRSLNNIKPIIPLGYQLPVEFYSPQYDTPEKINDPKPDLRTTIYWKSNVLTDDEGNAELDFYTADDPGTYSVIIEGVSDNGKLIHYCGKSLITVK